MKLQNCHSQLLCILMLLPLSTRAQSTKSLLAGSISWNVDPSFVDERRLVNFTLLTAFEVRDEDGCTFELDQEVQCSPPENIERFGRLCIDRYFRRWIGVSGRMEPAATYSEWCPVDEDDGPVLTGARNNFVVMDKRNVNGLNVVFGKKEVTARVNMTTTGLIAHLMLNPAAETTRTGVLLPQCVTNPDALKLPCAVNVFHNLSAAVFDDSVDEQVGNGSTPEPAAPLPTSPQFGLFKEEECVVEQCTYEGPSRSLYWRGFFDPLEDFAKAGSNLFKISPALETFVPLCTGDPDDPEHNCTSALNPLSNYFSPVPAFPPFVEVPITPYTQARSDIDSQFLTGSGDPYAAPHPYMYLKAMDYDGHQISHYDPLTAEARGRSNLRLECFEFLNASIPRDLVNPSAWPESVRWPDGPGQTPGSSQCKRYFDNDGSPGARFKFDFDFGDNPRLVPSVAELKRSPVFLNQFLLCADGSEPTPGAQPTCDDGTVVVQGNRMFSQHVLNTVDFPFVDVDNIDSRIPHIVDLPNWRYSPAIANLVDGSVSPPIPESAMVQSVLAAYPCFAGVENLPPKFVTSLDAVPDAAGAVQLEAGIDNVTTEVECTAGEECVIPLFAQDFDLHSINGAGAVDVRTADDCGYTRTADALSPPPFPDAGFQSCDVVQIELAAGWQGRGGKALHRAVCMQDPSRPCLRDSAECTCSGQADADAERPLVCESSGMTAGGDEQGHGAVKCFYKETMPLEDEGTFQVRCFVARDPHGDRFKNHAEWPVQEGFCREENGKDCGTQVPAGTDDFTLSPLSGDRRLTCSTQPMCVKIHVTGTRPEFVAPTPLEANSFDDNGLLVPNRTDVPACEGYPLQLTLAAKDPNSLDNVRIFVRDTDLDLTLRDAYLDEVSVLQFERISHNLDFFGTEQDITQQYRAAYPEVCEGTSRYDGQADKWSGFTAYGARIEGDNAGQMSILPLQEHPPKSVVSQYEDDVTYKPEPVMRVVYTLNVTRRNGIVTRLANPDDPSRFNCHQNDDPATDDNNCREKLLNMDQVICGKAYDDSRFRLKRWVGERNPNANAIPLASRDHSNGDMASALHCWRIKLQAPPVFVTDPTKAATPFSEDWSLLNDDGSPVTGRAEAYQSANVAINETVQFTFVAQDPNPEDSVKIFVVDDPGMPPGMRAEPTECIPRDGDQAMCKAVDQVDEVNKWLNPEVASACSKVRMTLTWTPDASLAGQVYRVCVVARDDSRLCAGHGPPDATTKGWYGEQQCVDLVVSEPQMEWGLTLVPSEIDSFVGCETRFNVTAKDNSETYAMVISPVGDLPAGAQVTSTTATMQRNAMTGYEERLYVVFFSWRPQRGSEGSTEEVCFTATDALQTQDPLPTQCWRMTVQRCRYCVGRGDTLGLVMKDYGLDTNWLRLWLHNGNTIPPTQRGPAIIPNPDLIVSPSSADSVAEHAGNVERLPIVYVGPVYRPKVGESLDTVAARFRTSVKSILSVNPDVHGEDDVEAGETELCIVPCSQRRPSPGMEAV